MGQVYFGVKKTQKFFLDEEKTQFVEFKKMSEGERAEYEDSVATAIFMNQDTREARIDAKSGADRAKLVNSSVIGYSVILGEPGVLKDQFSKEEWKTLFASMDADKAEELHQAILEFNGFKKKQEEKA
jgi:hypothetical protein